MPELSDFDEEELERSARRIMSPAEKAELREAQNEVRRTLILTPRWETPKLFHHKMQSLAWYHSAPVHIVPAGRRSGKTETLGKRKPILRTTLKGRSAARVLCGAPTYDQARDIFWDDLKAMVPEKWLAGKPNETRMTIRMRWGAYLRVMGLDNPQRVEGSPWDHLAIDELADCPEEIFDKHIGPGLNTPGREGTADLFGVPDEVGTNQAEYEKLWLTGLNWPNEDKRICSFWWHASDIVSKEKIEADRQRMDKTRFDQEYGGKFVRAGKLAFPQFDPTVHIDNGYYCEYSPHLPIDWTLDFGTSPAVSLICQTYQGQTWVLDEIEIDSGSTDVMTQAFSDRCRDNGYLTDRIRLYGDAAGRSPHSNIGKSDYVIIHEQTQHLGLRNIEYNNLMRNPFIRDTVNAVRGRLRSAAGRPNLFIHSRCKKLIEELNTAPADNDLRKFHATAALRYYLYELFGEQNESISIGRATLGPSPEKLSTRYAS